MYALGVAKYIFAFVMLVIQFKIAYVARNQARRIAQQEQRGSMNSRPSAPEARVNGSLPERGSVGQHRSSELKGVYVCIAVSASFFLCWLPTLTWLMYALGQEGDVSYTPLLPLSWLCASQCWVNTLIYLLMKKNYRHTMWVIMKQVSKKLGLSKE